MLKNYSPKIFIPFSVLQDRFSRYGWIYGFSTTVSHSLATVRRFKNSNPTRILVSDTIIIFNKAHKQELLGYINDLINDFKKVLIL